MIFIWRYFLFKLGCQGGWVAAVASAAASIFSALSASRGQSSANREEQSFNAFEAQKNRDWAENMSNTAFQRGRRDLEAAGYNPLLALGHGGASTPSAPAASAHPKSTTEKSSEYIERSAKQVSEMSLYRYQRERMAADATSAQSLARIHKQDADIATSGMGRKLAAWRYFLDKSGAGKVGAIAASAFGASKIFNALKSVKSSLPRISSAVRSSRYSKSGYRTLDRSDY